MNDLISRQELLNRTINNPLHPPYITEKDVLNCPSAQPGWIPTSERLPDNDRAVLVTLKWAEDDYEVAVVAVCEYWHNSTASHVWGSFEGHVIAWMPLPTPYREGGQDGKT